MGAQWSKYTMSHLWKEDEPESIAPIKYDPRFGFGEDRKVRPIPATREEMDSARIDGLFRDHCVDIRLYYNGCINHNFPFWYKCKGMYEELENCYWELKMGDIKEFEREKRLNRRERRLTGTSDI